MATRQGGLFCSGPALLSGRFLLCRGAKLELKLAHPYFLAAEFYAFHFQAKTLVQAAFAGNRNPATGSHPSMPGKSVGSCQRAHYLAGRAGKASRTGDRSVTGNMAARNLQDGL